ncbi:MAG: hypothetical protein ACFHX7_02170 [Pseudomonadota bacterium]
MPAICRSAACLVVVLILGGCSTMRLDPAAGILGAWRTDLAGFPVTVVYTETTVQVGNAEPVPYTLTGDELRFAGGDSQLRRVSFPSGSVMLQVDPLTGTEQSYQRLADRR